MLFYDNNKKVSRQRASIKDSPDKCYFKIDVNVYLSFLVVLFYKTGEKKSSFVELLLSVRQPDITPSRRVLFSILSPWVQSWVVVDLYIHHTQSSKKPQGFHIVTQIIRLSINVSVMSSFNYYLVTM